MGGAIAKGIAKSAQVECERLAVTHAREDLRLWNERNGGCIEFVEDNRAAVEEADVVVIAVKPYKVEELLAQVRDTANFVDKTIISVAAGVSCDSLAQMCQNQNQAVFRVIPNTAIMLGEGVTFVSCTPTVSTSMRKVVKTIFAAMGSVFEVNEEQMSPLTALSSCGIAYVMRFIADMQQSGVRAGVSPQVSRDVVLQTVRGAVALLAAEGADAESEIRRVCTPGGITEQGLKAMQEGGFSQAVEAGIRASTK